MAMRSVISAPKASALIESTRSIGYSFESAIADIIDNSISAYAKKIFIQSVPSDDPYVAILDDGIGLDSAALQEAMRYGSNPNAIRDSNDLGRFGLGMKTASLSQCRKLTVISLAEGIISACRWDLDKVIETDEWTLLIMDESDVAGLPLFDDLKKQGKGTLVVWENLDRGMDKSKDPRKAIVDDIDRCKAHLSMTFHRFMDNEVKADKVTIFVNKVKLEPADPFLSNHGTTKMLPEEVINTENGVIHVTPFILPPESKLTAEDIRKLGGLDPKMQGFYVYRNKRLIVSGTWFRLTKTLELRKLVRVRVDIPNTLDFMWDIDIKKSNATIPVQFRDQFTKALSKVIENGEKRTRFKGRKANDENVFVWDKIVDRDSTMYCLNREHPVIKRALSLADRGEIEELLTLIESSVPFRDIYITIADDKDNKVTTGKQNEDELLNLALRLVTTGETIENIANTEPFNEYPLIIEKVREFVR